VSGVSQKEFVTEPFCDDVDLMQERQADYRILSVPGAHAAIGQYLGETTPLRIIPQRTPQKPDLEFGWACLREVGRLHPGLEAEYRAFAEAKRVPLEDVLAHVSLNVTRGQIGQCSTVGYRRPDGGVLIGRNYDFRYRQQQRYLICTNPPGYAAHVGTNSGLVGGRYDGVNEFGVFVSLHTVLSDRIERIRPGVPFHLVVRIALETCRTAREAMTTIRLMPLFHSFNYFVADRDEMYVVESHGETIRVSGGRTGVLAVTNHYQHPDLQRLHGRRPLTHSRGRLARLREGPVAWDAGDLLRSIEAVMRDHSAHVCGHDDGAATLWSAVCDPASRRVAYSLGAPCRNPYFELPWPGGPSGA
jgi:hypothetical protein